MGEELLFMVIFSGSKQLNEYTKSPQRKEQMGEKSHTVSLNCISPSCRLAMPLSVKAELHSCHRIFIGRYLLVQSFIVFSNTSQAHYTDSANMNLCACENSYMCIIQVKYYKATKANDIYSVTLA